MIEVRGVSVRYNGHDVVRGVDLTVGAGEWVGLIGPNGAGKSTLLKAIAGTVRSTGDISIEYRPASEVSRREMGRSVAVVPQSPLLPEGMAIIDYVLLGRTPHLGRSSRGTTHRPTTAPTVANPPHRRATFASALVCGPLTSPCSPPSAQPSSSPSAAEPAGSPPA